MPLGDVDAASRLRLRALAHPLRLRMLSLLTAAPMSAAELARELDGTHANASYHLRTLAAAHLVEVDSERSVRGGRERRYRVSSESDSGSDVDTVGALPAALSAELRRRWPERAPAAPRTTVDAELWVDPATWEQVVADVRAAMSRLHDSARKPRADGAVRTSTTVALFGMTS